MAKQVTVKVPDAGQNMVRGGFEPEGPPVDVSERQTGSQSAGDQLSAFAGISQSCVSSTVVDQGAADLTQTRQPEQTHPNRWSQNKEHRRGGKATTPVSK